MGKSENNGNTDFTEINVGKIVLRITVLLSVIVLGAYLLVFVGHEVEAKTSTWGAFGDYIGGVLNPLFALVAIYMIYVTYSDQKKEFKKLANNADKNNFIQRAKFQPIFQINRFDHKEFLNEVSKSNLKQETKDVFLGNKWMTLTNEQRERYRGYLQKERFDFPLVAVENRAGLCFEFKSKNKNIYFEPFVIFSRSYLDETIKLNVQANVIHPYENKFYITLNKIIEKEMQQSGGSLAYLVYRDISSLMVVLEIRFYSFQGSQGALQYDIRYVNDFEVSKEHKEVQKLFKKNKSNATNPPSSETSSLAGRTITHITN